jgi:large subunit ribosomal protein L15
MRVPKLRGFNNPNKEEFAIVNVGTLSTFRAGTEVTPEKLREQGLIRRRGRVKVLAEGDLSKKLTVKTHAISSAARKKIEEAGGSVEIIS